MKVNHNDLVNKSTKEIKNLNIHKKSHVSSPNNQRIISPILKANKTIQKYINTKLNSKNKINNNSKKDDLANLQIKPKINFKHHPNLIKNKLIASSKQRYNQKKKEVSKNKKENKSKNKVKNSKTKDKITNYKCIENNNSSLNIFSNKKQNSKESKLINTISTSSGISVCSNENKKCLPFSHNEIRNNSNNSIYNNLQSENENKNNFYNNYNSDDIPSIQNNNNINNVNWEKQFLQDTNRYKPNINNFNYESGSDDNCSDNKVYIKCENYSLLTFGNSFSYSNSQRSKSTQKNWNNEENNGDKNKTINFCKDLMINYNNNKNNNYVNKLKEENETLKKELKESNEQINFLIYQIKELKQNKSFRDKKYRKNKKICSPNIWKNKNIKLSLMDKENKNCKNDINYNCDYKESDKFIFNKDLLKDINKTICDKNCYKNCKKKIIIKRKLYHNKDNKKIRNKNNSVCALERPCKNISECISKLKI